MLYQISSIYLFWFYQVMRYRYTDKQSDIRANIRKSQTPVSLRFENTSEAEFQTNLKITNSWEQLIGDYDNTIKGFQCL